MTSKFKYYVVSAVDSGETCDGKPRVLLLTEKEEEAKAYVENDMKDYVDNATDDNGNCIYDVVDFDKMSIHTNDFSFGCEWNIETVDLEVPNLVKMYLKELVKLRECDYCGMMELLESDPRRQLYVQCTQHIRSLYE